MMLVTIERATMATENKMSHSECVREQTRSRERNVSRSQ
jgi:hypothetical protein